VTPSQATVRCKIGAWVGRRSGVVGVTACRDRWPDLLVFPAGVMNVVTAAAPRKRHHTMNTFTIENETYLLGHHFDGFGDQLRHAPFGQDRGLRLFDVISFNA
jgi:hypothetical protein